MSSLTVSGGVDPSLSAQSSALPDDTVGLTFIHVLQCSSSPLEEVQGTGVMYSLEPTLPFQFSG